MLAGGSGARFGSPKQFLELANGVRLIDAAVQTVIECCDETVVVLPQGGVWDGASVHASVVGGSDRLASVRAGLGGLSAECDVILVHDAGHPLASPETGRQVISAVLDGADAAVPWLPVVDVLKRQRADGSLETAGRDGIGQAQTPHAFKADLLRQLHLAKTQNAWEDTQLIEEQGGRVVPVPGDAGNIHVVTPADLDVARRLFSAYRGKR